MAHETPTSSPAPLKGALLLTLLLGAGLAPPAQAGEGGRQASPQESSPFGVGFPVGVVTSGEQTPGVITLRSERGSYEVVEGELLVRLRGDVGPSRAQAILDSLGLELRETGAYSGILRVGLPQGLSLREGARRLTAQREVVAAWPNALIRGDGLGQSAKSSSLLGSLVETVDETVDDVVETVDDVVDTVDETVDDVTGAPSGDRPEYRDHQWPLDAMMIEEGQLLGMDGLDQITVAVLDTGAAYEAWDEGDLHFTLHPALSGTTFVAPYDALAGDTHANDDHHHGTHVAGLIAGEGGKTVGAAPGVKIMPVKVLDSAMRGTELSLVEGLLHAVENGADVVNMSLTFGVGYFPSPILQEAVAIAQLRGVVMVASAGNTAKVGVGYPAAFPDVIAVGASRMSFGAGAHRSVHAYYSSWGFPVDLLAPGGMMEGDMDLDGHPDGILGPAFPPGQPDVPEYWYFSGTSQAAPFISAMAAYLLADGVAPNLVDDTLAEAAKIGCLTDLNLYCGAGQPDLLTARTINVPDEADTYPVNVTTWLETDAQGALRGIAEVKAYKEDMASPLDVLVGGSWMGSHLDPEVSGWTGKDGVIRFVTPPLDPAADLALAFQVERIWAKAGGKPVHPIASYALSPALAETVAQLTLETDGQTPVLLFEMGAKLGGPSPEVGALASSFLVKSLGTGLPSGPISLTLNAGMLETVIGIPTPHGEIVFPSPLDSGVGVLGSVSVNAIENSEGILLTIPYDPAISGGDPHRFLPVLSAVPAEFIPANLALGATLSCGDLARSFPNKAWGSGYASASLGDGLSQSDCAGALVQSEMGAYLGTGMPLEGTTSEGFAALGTGFFSSTMGAGFFSSTMGAGFFSSTMGAGFFSSTMGAGFFSSTMGAGFFSSTIGAGFFSSTMGADFEGATAGTANTSSSDTGQAASSGSPPASAVAQAFSLVPVLGLIPEELLVPAPLVGLPPSELP